MASSDDLRLTRFSHKPWWKKTSTCWVIRLEKGCKKKFKSEFVWLNLFKPQILCTHVGNVVDTGPTTCRHITWKRAVQWQMFALQKKTWSKTLIWIKTRIFLFGFLVHWQLGLIKTLLHRICFCEKCSGSSPKFQKTGMPILSTKTRVKRTKIWHFLSLPKKRRWPSRRFETKLLFSIHNLT